MAVREKTLFRDDLELKCPRMNAATLLRRVNNPYKCCSTAKSLFSILHYSKSGDLTMLESLDEIDTNTTPANMLLEKHPNFNSKTCIIKCRYVRGPLGYLRESERQSRNGR